MGHLGTAASFLSSNSGFSCGLQLLRNKFPSYQCLACNIKYNQIASLSGKALLDQDLIFSLAGERAL